MLPHTAGICLALSLASALSSAQAITGTVFLDRNGDGRRSGDESGAAGVVVSNQVDVVVTDARGAFTLPGPGSGVVFVSLPEGSSATTRFWQPAGGETLTFGLTTPGAPGELTFLHASDTHIQPSAVPRFDRLRAIIDSVKPAFVIISGDLVRDALRVGEAEATGYYELFGREAAKIQVPVWTAVGNHELFGIERDKSGVSADHPLFARGMYRKYQGPDYYSFNAGGVHFVGLNTADISDQSYHGHVDSTQLRWLARDLAAVPPNVPVVTFNHIPLATAAPALWGVESEPPAPTIIRINGKDYFRHVVSNLPEVLAVIGNRPFPLALGGHNHALERTVFGTDGRPTRFEQTGAVVGPGGTPWMRMASGVTVFRVRSGVVSEGTYVRLDRQR